ncbi:MAG: exopolyphosphatase/guanosine-5'-triphosphate,3'-diphosphate pyrophosphatase [Saprospiraceae bacterium]|jgi:exopolyphosphatase/guanosine-5'-triphosphate,3'-diphosphate pyrophosphatase
MNIAVIDLGTNTFNLLIASVNNSSFRAIYATKEFVQLGKGGINSKIIRGDAFERGLNTLTRFKDKSTSLNCEHIFCIATSAVRNASNGQSFVSEVKQKLNLDIQVIDGNKEAEYIYLGAKQAIQPTYENMLIMDVGGGSTEFIICNEDKIFWKQSFEIGVARLFEAFHKTNPISHEEVLAIEKHLSETLKPLIDAVRKHGVYCLIGCSGAFSSFASMIMHIEDNDDMIDSPTEYLFDIKKFFHVHNDLLKSTLEERLELKGLIKQRAPMIVVGSILVNYILTELSVTKFELSKYALKEGVIIDFIKNGGELTNE